MAASDAGAWARLTLVQGAAEPLRWELDGSRGEARLTVGSDAGCAWMVRDESVAPVHLTIRWDGSHLEVADSHGAGGVRLDGERVGLHFARVYGRSRIEFGRCAIVAETSGRVGRSTVPPVSGTVPPPSDAATGAAGKALGGRTLLGVSPTSSGKPPPGGQSSRDPTPTGMRRGARPPKATVMGVGPARAPEEASREPGPRASPRPVGSTIYGLGRGDDLLSHPVDFVSPERLRQSSVPPAQQASEAAAARKAGRTTRMGFAGDVPPPQDRVTQPGFADELAARADAAPDAPAGSALERPQDAGPGGYGGPVEDEDGVWPRADEPTYTPWRADPRGRPESAVWPAVVGIAAVLAFGVWVYALLTL